MKKFLALAAVMLGLASCQTEPEGFDVNVGGEQDVNITVSLPEGTRADSALGAFAHVDFTKYDVRFQCEVHYGDQVKKLPAQYGRGNDAVATATFPVRLIANRDYTFVVWADLVEEGKTEDLHYNTANGLKQIEIKDWKAMDETRDAYTCSETRKFTRANGIGETLTLTRPFAKLRVVTTDMEELMGVKPTWAKVEYATPYYTSFNAYDQKPYDLTSTGKAHSELFDIVSYGESGASKTLFTDYFFAINPENGQAPETVAFTMEVFDENGATIDEPKSFNTSIPVKRNYLTTIKGNILTYADDFDVVINPAFDGEDAYVDSRNAAQSSLDYAIDNTTIYLEKDVDYGTLYIRPVAGASNTTTDCDYLVYRNEMHRSVKNLTIVGAEGATVDAIKVVAGYVQDSGSTGYVVDIENLVIDGVKFTDKHTNAPHSYAAPIFIDLTYTNVDGLTVKNCKLEGDNDKMNFVYVYGSGNPSNSTFATAAKNIVLENNYVDGIARLCELRQTENVTITNNTIKNTALHAILLPVDNGTYSGNVTITDNYAEGINERFVRMAGAGNATVVIKDNLINNYNGDDADYIKVSDYNDVNNVTIENNFVGPIADYDAFLAQLSDDTWYDATQTELAIEDVADFAAFVETANSGNDFAGKTIKLNGDIDLYFKDVTAMADGDPVTFRPIGDTKYNGGEPFRGTFDGQGHTIKNLYQNGWDLGYDYDHYGSYGLFGNLENAIVKNVVIEGSESYIERGDVSFIAGSATGNCVFENIEIKSGAIATYDNGNGGIIGWSGAGSYTFKNIKLGADVVIAGMWGSFDQSCGGIVGQAEPGATYNFENVEINCRLDVYNDVTAAWQYYLYRMCGMIIGRCEETTTIDGRNYPDLSKYNMTFNNVVVNYGDWMNYHYQVGHGGQKGTGARVEEGYRYGGHSCASDGEAICIPFDQLIGGDQLGVRGLREVAGVTVNYPESYRREVSTTAQLTEALSNGLSVVLDADIDFGSTQLAITGENQVVDLGGHALTTANNWGGISLKNGATIKNGTITHAGNTAAIKAFNGSSVENVTINATCTTADKTVTGIAVQQGANVESIKNVTINGVSQGIEVGYQATVGLIENAVVNESNNGTAKGIGLVINGGKVGLAKNCTFKGETYGITMHLKGVFAVGLELQNCVVEGATAAIYAWDEKGISNTSGSLNLTYDAATTLIGELLWDFEDECKDVVTLHENRL